MKLRRSAAVTSGNQAAEKFDYSSCSFSACADVVDLKTLPRGTKVYCSSATAERPWSMLLCGSTISCGSGRLTYDRASAIVGIHGGPGQSSGILGRLSQLANMTPVLLYDQAGSGRSIRTKSYVLDSSGMEETMNAYVKELEEVLKYRGIVRVHLVGHSFGASIAGVFAERHSNVVLSMSLFSAFINVDWWSSDGSMHQKHLTQYGGFSSASRQDISEELQNRWVLGKLSMQEVAPLLCNPSDAIYGKVWGTAEDLPDGQVAKFRKTMALAEIPQIRSGEMNILIGCGLLDESTPERLHQLMNLLGKRVKGIVLPHSAHIIAPKDWILYLDGIRSVISQYRLPLRKPFVTPPVFHLNIARIRDSLLRLEQSSNIAHRSYPYLGRLLTSKAVPAGGLVQADARQMQQMATAEELDWDEIQAVCDVWYISVVLSAKNSHQLRPPDALIMRLTHKLKSDRASGEPIDLLMWYVVGKSLGRLGVTNAPEIPAYEWKNLARSVDMENRYPALYMYLLTHVYLYNTDFGKLDLSELARDVKTEVLSAGMEILKLMPLAVENRGLQHTFSGISAPGWDPPLETVFDLVCELSFTVTRIFGREHPSSEALAMLIREFLSSDNQRWVDDWENQGHLMAVCLSASQIFVGGGWME